MASFFQVSPTKIHVYGSIIPNACDSSRPSYNPDLITLIIFGKELHIMQFYLALT